MPWDPKSAGDPLWKHTAATWILDMSVLLFIGVLCGLVVARLLRRHEPEVMRK
jgi:uncharacterized membrane-anchored protein YhcB (DUF1043 family)